MPNQIKGLNGFHWVYKGQKDEFGVPAGARYAYNPTTHETLTYRQAYTRAHGNVSHEKRVPEQQRKKYVRRSKNKKYDRYGPYYSIQEMMNESRLKNTDEVIPSAYGKLGTNNGKTSKGKKVYSNLAGLTDYATLKNVMGRYEDKKTPLPSQTYDTRLQKNLNAFTSVDKFYIFKKV